MLSYCWTQFSRGYGCDAGAGRGFGGIPRRRPLAAASLDQSQQSLRLAAIPERQRLGDVGPLARTAETAVVSNT